MSRLGFQRFEAYPRWDAVGAWLHAGGGVLGLYAVPPAVPAFLRRASRVVDGRGRSRY